MMGSVVCSGRNTIIVRGTVLVYFFASGSSGWNCLRTVLLFSDGLAMTNVDKCGGFNCRFWTQRFAQEFVGLMWEWKNSNVRCEFANEQEAHKL